MARTVKPEKVAEKRKEILNATQRLVFTKGYEQMSIQDVLDEVKISSGAFHHYFDSRSDLLEALIQRIKEESGKPLLLLTRDPHLSAIQKFQGFFNTLDTLRLERRAEITQLGRVWYNDDNAVVRQKVAEAIFEQRAPMIAEIVRQGIQEGVFNAPNPDKAGEVIMSLVQGMGDVHAKLMLAVDQAYQQGSQNSDRIKGLVAEIVSTYTAYMDALERVLGAPPRSIMRTDLEAINDWVEALKQE